MPHGPEAQSAAGYIRVLEIHGITNSVINGVTVENGYLSGYVVAGGILVSNSTVTFDDCVIQSNQITHSVNHYPYGAGMYTLSSSVLMTNCVVRGNRIRDGAGAWGGGGYGGGIYVASGSLTLRNSSIVKNVAYSAGNSGGSGGGLYLAGGPSLVENCIIENNTAEGAGYGGGNGAGIYITGASAGTVRNCVINKNTSASTSYNTGNGGGIYADGGVFQNCLIISNIVKDAGGGARLTHASVRLLNCTVADNRSTYGDAAGVSMSAGCLTNTIVYFNQRTMDNQEVNIVRSGGTIGYTCSRPVESGNNNVASDPEFAARADGNYRLSAGSPCYNSGMNQPWMTNKTDLAGSPRIVNVTVDRGAYEAPPPDSGGLGCNFTGTPVEGIDNLPVVFTASLEGSNKTGVVYRWDFDGNGSFEKEGAGFACITNPYGIGYHTVKLTVTNSAGEIGQKTKPSYVHVSPGIIYVATNGLNGAATNWSTAKTNIQSALDEAVSNNLILLAGHTFRPASSILLSNKRGIRIQGGYAATNAAGPGAWDPLSWPTTVWPRSSGYRTMVVSSAQNCGASNIVFSGASCSSDGGALYIASSTFRLYGCTLSNNYTSCGVNQTRSGGGIYGTGGTVAVERCMIRQNTVHAAAPGWSGNCYGGGAYVASGNWTIKESVFLANTANGQNNEGAYGGGIHIAGGTVLIRNCVVSSNRTASIGRNGGGIYSSAGTIVQNCTAADNSCTRTDAQGGGIYVNGGSVTNCIFYQNRNGSGYNNTGGNVASIRYSSSPDLTHGVNGNTTNQPVFQDMVYYHLKSRAGTYLGGYFDGGHWGIATENSSCIDEGAPDMPYSRELYPHGFRVNMGAYGNTPAASKTFITATIILVM